MGKLTKDLFNAKFNSLANEYKDAYVFNSSNNKQINLIKVDDDILDTNNDVIAKSGEVFYNVEDTEEIWRIDAFTNEPTRGGLNTRSVYPLRVTLISQPEDKRQPRGKLSGIDVLTNEGTTGTALRNMLANAVPTVKDYDANLKNELQQVETNLGKMDDQSAKESAPVSLPVNPKGGDMEGKNDGKLTSQQRYINKRPEIEAMIGGKDLLQHAEKLAVQFGRTVDFWKKEIKNAIADKNSVAYKNMKAASLNVGLNEVQRSTVAQTLFYVEYKQAQNAELEELNKQLQIIADGDAKLARSQERQAARTADVATAAPNNVVASSVDKDHIVISKDLLEKVKQKKLRKKKPSKISKTKENQETQSSNENKAKQQNPPENKPSKISKTDKKVPFLKKKSGKVLVAVGVVAALVAIAGAITGAYFGGKTDGQEVSKDPGQSLTPSEDQTAASAETIATAGSTVGDALGKNVEKTILVNGGKTLYTVDNEGRVYKLDLDNKLTDNNVADALGTKYDIQDNIQQVGVDWTKFYNEGLYQKFECYEGVGVKDEFEKYLSRTLGIENNDNLIFIAKVNENNDNTANVDITVIGNKKGNEDVATVEKDYKVSDLDKVDSSIPMDDKTGMILLRTMGVGIGDWKCEDITPKQEISKISGTDYAFVDGRNM